MADIKSKCYVTFEEYKELNPLLCGDNPEYERTTMAMEDNMMNFICGLFG